MGKIGRSFSVKSEPFLILECKAKNMELVINEKKTKYKTSNKNYSTKVDVQIRHCKF